MKGRNARRHSALRSEVPDNPVEAELYEEHFVTAAVIKEGDSVEETNNKRTRVA